MLRGRPTTHVVTALCYEPQRRIGTDAVDLTEVHADHSEQRGPDVECGLVSGTRGAPWRQGCGRVNPWFQCFQCLFDDVVAVTDLRSIRVVEFERLP